MTESPGVRTGLVAAAVGGALGSLGRWALTATWPAAATGDFPWTVLVVNVVGSAALAGLALVPLVRRRPWLSVLLGTGVCGGFTTMSTASVDGLGLLDDGRWAAAAAYVGGTLGASLLAVALVVRVAGTARERAVDDEGGDL
ncbi:fluoride efflux transporter FluC [Nocardioides marmoraquaticus]